MRNFQYFFFLLKRSYICHYIICMTVPLSKRNKKYEIYYKNFALWKIETIVDVEGQKQSPRGILKIVIEIFCKLNKFLQFQNFSLVLNNRLNNLKRFLFRLYYWNFPILKQKPIFWTNKIENCSFSMKPCMCKELYIRGLMQ